MEGQQAVHLVKVLRLPGIKIAAGDLFGGFKVSGRYERRWQGRRRRGGRVRDLRPASSENGDDKNEQHSELTHNDPFLNIIKEMSLYSKLILRLCV